jgi:hypothetical protein
MLFPSRDAKARPCSSRRCTYPRGRASLPDVPMAGASGAGEPEPIVPADLRGPGASAAEGGGAGAGG